MDSYLFHLHFRYLQCYDGHLKIYEMIWWYIWTFWLFLWHFSELWSDSTYACKMSQNYNKMYKFPFPVPLVIIHCFIFFNEKSVANVFDFLGHKHEVKTLLLNFQLAYVLWKWCNWKRNVMNCNFEPLALILFWLSPPLKQVGDPCSQVLFIFMFSFAWFSLWLNCK